MKEVYIFGHKNPDTDSIVSSIAYANLKRELSWRNVKAFRLGKLNLETEFVLKHFAYPVPKLLKGIHPELSDLYTERPILVHESTSLGEVWETMKKTSFSILTVVNDKKKLLGIISINDIISFIMDKSSENIKTIKSLPISEIYKKEKILYFHLNDIISEAKEIMKNSKQTYFPILDKEGKVYGIISENSTLNFARKNVILMDHNEMSQSVDGLEAARIIEVIDHHRIANINTFEPLVFRSEPLGSTSTIVTKLYKENNIVPNKQIAGLLLSGIISDTLIFKSPTCTNEDKELAYELSEVAEVKIHEYGIMMLSAGTSYENKKVEDIIFGDMKEFVIGTDTIVISQVNTLDFKKITSQKEKILKLMNNYKKYNKVDLVILMITNIIEEGTKIIAVGDIKERLAKAFNTEILNDEIYLKGVVSRKKQVVPNLIQASQD